MNSGILLLNKPDNITSNAIINKVKYELNQKGYNIKKIGHAGTLDPNATGLLVVLLNEATKISDYLLLNDKEYTAKVLIGKKTSTEDIWGETLEDINLNEDDLKIVSENIDSVLANLIGKVNQVPPMYSSIKIHGKKLYEYARNGEEIDLSDRTREIEIISLKRISECALVNDKIEFSIHTKVSKGTYIRTLCSLIGKCLGYPSTMAALERNKSGDFSLNDAYSVDEIINENFKLVNILDALNDFTQIEANEKLKKDCLNGKKINLDIKDDEVVIKSNKTIIGIYIRESKDTNIFKAKRVWN